MALLLIPWVCLSMIICLALMRAAVRPVSKPRPLPANATPDPFTGYFASLQQVDLERELMAAREVPSGGEGRRNPEPSKPVQAETIPWNVLVAKQNPGS